MEESDAKESGVMGGNQEEWKNTPLTKAKSTVAEKRDRYKIAGKETKTFLTSKKNQ